MALLANHIAVITGAGSGIGRAIAAGYAREGAQVVLLDVNADTVAEAAEGIRKSGGKAESFALDVTRRDDCFALARQVADKVGQVSISSTMPASPAATPSPPIPRRWRRIGMTSSRSTSTASST